jgi:hypothetical protein
MTKEAHTLSIVRSALDEWFWHGKDVYHEWRARLIGMMVKADLGVYLEQSPLPTWADLKERYDHNSQQFLEHNKFPSFLQELGADTDEEFDEQGAIEFPNCCLCKRGVDHTHHECGNILTRFEYFCTRCNSPARCNYCDRVSSPLRYTANVERIFACEKCFQELLLSQQSLDEPLLDEHGFYQIDISGITPWMQFKFVLLIWFCFLTVVCMLAFFSYWMYVVIIHCVVQWKLLQPQYRSRRILDSST